MASGEEGEKKLPPSEIKLRRLRRDGKSPQANEFRGALSFVLGVTVLFSAFTSVISGHMSLFGDMFQSVAHPGRPPTFSGAAQLVGVSLGLLAISVLGFCLAMLLEGQSFGVHMDLLAPNGNRLNPIEGVKKRFGMQALVQISNDLVKALVLGTAFALTARILAADILWAPTCGFDCATLVAQALLSRMLVILLIVVAVFGVLDLKKTRWLFNREHRMTRAEAKREGREEFGDPEMVRARKTMQFEAVQGTRSVPISRTSVIILGPDSATAIYYAAGSNAAPVVLRTVAGDGVPAFLAEMARLRIPVVVDERTAGMLSRLLQGQFIPENAYAGVAGALRRVGFTV